MLFEFISTISAGLFAGAALYITFVEHPARMEGGAELALAEFAPSYRRATVMQATLAAIGSVSSFVAWWINADRWWLFGGLILGSVIPFTLIVILPTNKRLVDPALETRTQMASELLARWAKLHAVRTFLSLIAFAIFLVTSL
jgi:uncharacterized membrane protein